MEKGQFLNSFSNDIPASSPPPYSAATGTIQNFTATGRPFNPSTSSHGSGLASLGSADAMGAGYPDHLPRRYTDADMISIPVLPPKDTPPTTTTKQSAPPTQIYSGPAADDKDGPIKHERRSSIKFWKSRSSSNEIIGGASSSPKQKKNKDKFVMKFVTRGDYLKYYAKDEQGKYIGTEDPAEDCILKDVGDLLKWRARKAAHNVHMATEFSAQMHGLTSNPDRPINPWHDFSGSETAVENYHAYRIGSRANKVHSNSLVVGMTGFTG